MVRHEEADRVPFADYAWGTTVARWREEGLPTNDYIGYFDLDRVIGIRPNNSPRYPAKTIEETDAYTITTTEWGVTLKNWKHITSTPEYMDFTVKDRPSWAEAKALMTPDHDRIPWDLLKREYKGWRESGARIEGGPWFGFDITHSWMSGTERILMALLEDPEWCFEMFSHQLDISLTLLEAMWDAGYTFDSLRWPDDMGYKGTQFFSLGLYREIIRPVQQRAIDWAHGHGIPAELHSCGDIRPFIPDFIDMGLDILNPLEVKAGVDPIAVKKSFGDKLTLHGGVNAVLWDDAEAICAEIERAVPILKENGGYIFASDHSIPSSVSFDNMKRIIVCYKRCARY